VRRLILIYHFTVCFFICVVSYVQWTKHVLVICVGQEVVCHESPRPTAGIHRFVFVLFRQLGRQTVYAPGWRQNFNTRDFAELYNLGSPVATVYFNCQRESGSGGRRPWEKDSLQSRWWKDGGLTHLSLSLSLYIYIYIYSTHFGVDDKWQEPRQNNGNEEWMTVIKPLLLSKSRLCIWFFPGAVFLKKVEMGA